MPGTWAEGFSDRFAAGRELAEKLAHHRGTGAVVLGLARGGIAVASEVARSLELSLDVLVVRKLGVPEQPELAMGAVASGGVRVLNEEVLRATGVEEDVLERLIARESAEVERLERAYRAPRPALEVGGRTAILVDDGLATGSSMLAAVRVVRDRDAVAAVAAVPIAPQETCAAIAADVEELACLWMPRPFLSVGTWYADFRQVDDDEVRRLITGVDVSRRSPAD